MTTDLQRRLDEVLRDVFDQGLPDGDLSQLVRENVEAWDSLGHIRLVTALEETFGTTFTIEEIEGMVSVPRILDVVTSRA